MSSGDLKVEQPDATPADSTSITIPEFCAAEQISEPTYHKLRQRGLGPREMRYPGLKIVRISAAAHEEWRKRMENPTPAMKKQIEADYRARSERLRAAGKRGAASPKHPCRTGGTKRRKAR
jgi:hypothetical protein